MAQSRSAVPAQLKRKLFEEAGYRCAVPTCRGTSALQMEHIEEWAEVKAHDFENMIILCAVCHNRVTSREIHKDAIRAYKRNLAIISGRYSLFELRVLEVFWDGIKQQKRVQVPIAENDMLHVKGLFDDGLVNRQEIGGSVHLLGVSVTPIPLVSTEAGDEFIRRFFEGKELE